MECCRRNPGVARFEYKWSVLGVGNNAYLNVLFLHPLDGLKIKGLRGCKKEERIMFVCL